MIDILTSLSIYKLLIKKKFEFIRISDFLIIGTGLVALGYLINKLLLKGQSENYESLTYSLLFLTALFIGLLAIAEVYSIHEIKFLLSSSVRRSLPVLLLLIKVLVPLSGANLLMLSVVLWGGLQFSVVHLFLELNAGFLAGGASFLGVQYFIIRLRNITFKGAAKQHSFISSHPALKKELLYLSSLQRTIPLAFVVAICQISLFFLRDYPSALLVIIMLIIVFMHDAWTVNLLGLEENSINLYLFNQLDIRQLIFIKWSTCFVVTFIISTVNYFVWSIWFRPSTSLMLSQLTRLMLFNLSLSLIGILLGLYFSDFLKKGYYRIQLSGILIFAFSTAILFYLTLSYVPAILIALCCITIFSLKIFKNSNIIRGALYD